ncbi:MAG: hypothetical protein AAF456_12455 [Planctomycetota bacterium]
MNRPLPGMKTDSYERPNEKWTETVLVASEDGAEVTTTQRSLRNKRAVFTLAVTSFIVGTTLILFNSPYRNEFLAPGPLCSSHAQILAGQGADRCAACHGAGDKSFAQWFSDAISGGRSIGACQSDLCMECHKNSLNADYALVAHNVDPAVLAEMTAEKQRSGQFSLASYANVPGPPVNPLGELACSTCHREHHGSESLSALTDAQCQICHSDQIHSFEKDHPEFTSTPFNRRSRIAFDHTTHGLKHFAQSGMEFDCAQCHIDDERYDTKVLAPFEQSCAMCHEDEIIDSTSRDTLAMISLPMLDLDAISDAGGDIGQWPEMATGDFDGPLPGIMRLLLTADDEAAAILATLDRNFEFGDVDPYETDQVLQACDLVWSIKRLMHELSVEGSEAIKRRLEIVLERSISDDELVALTDGLEAPVFQEATRRWLPELTTELAVRTPGLQQYSLSQFGDGEVLFHYRPRSSEDTLAENPLKELMSANVSADQPAPSTPDPAPETVAPQQELAVVSTTPDPRDTSTPPAASQVIVNNERGDGGDEGGVVRNQTLRETPPVEIPAEQLLVENPLKERVEQTPGNTGAPVQVPPVAANAGQDDAPLAIVNTQSGSERQIVNQSSSPTAAEPSMPVAGNRQPTGEVLAANPLKERFGAPPVVPADPAVNLPVVNAPDVAQTVEPMEDEVAVIPNPHMETGINLPAVADSAPVSVPVSDPPGEVAVVARGAWIRNDLILQIGYRPEGHADSTLSEWADMITSVENADVRFETSALFEELTRQNSIGTCRNCHTVDRNENAFVVNWNGENHTSALREFTKFVHGPHLIQPHLQDCSYCHTLDPESNSVASFEGFDSTVSISNFEPIVKDNCASCHREGQTDSGCTQCHNYHVGSRRIGD